MKKQKKTAAYIQAKAYHLIQTDTFDHLRQLQLQRSLRRFPVLSFTEAINDCDTPGCKRKEGIETAVLEKNLSEYQTMVQARKKVFYNVHC